MSSNQLIADILREVDKRIKVALKSFRFDLRNTTGAIPGTQLPTTGNTGTGYTPGDVSVTTGKLADDAVTFAKMQNIATDRLIGRDTAATGDPEQLTVGGGVEFSGSGGIQRSALTGDVTASAGSNSTTLASVGTPGTYTKVTTDAKGRVTSGTTLAASDLPSHDHTGSSDGGKLTNDAHDGYSVYEEIAAPSSPAGNTARLYARDKSGVTELFYKNDAGTERDLSASGGGGMTDPTTTLGDLIVNDGSGVDRLGVGTDTYVLTADSGEALGVKWAAPSGGGSAEGHILIVDSKSPGTAGGTFTPGAWRTRDLNTERYDTGGNASVGSNQITLAAGTYRCRIEVPAWLANQNQARLYDITNSAVLLVGSNAYASRGGSDQVMSVSTIVGRFTLSGSTVIEVQHQCQFTQATNGFGLPMNGSFTVTEEIYTQAEFWKE